MFRSGRTLLSIVNIDILIYSKFSFKGFKGHELIKNKRKNSSYD